MSRLLTIIVPTYNRAACLSMLLDALTVELLGLEDRVNVVIGDNASNDGTPAVTAAFADRWSATRVLRHPENLGPDENFCHCVEAVLTPYFWIIGDDDLPRAGAIPLLIRLLETQDPDLVYLSSRWTATLTSHDEAGTVSNLRATLMERAAFARTVHVWTTFISGAIVKRELAPDESLRRFTGSLLVQLGWVLGALREGRRFVHVAEPCVLATAGNTGGYGVLKVFGNNFQRVTREAFSQTASHRSLAEAIVLRTSIAFLPDLIWGVRQARLGSFDPNESIAANLEPQLGRSWPYRLLIRPLGHATPSQGRWLLRLAHVAARFIKRLDVVRMRLSGQARPL
ncbi:glycosyltransferase family 2 protein [Roseateles chitinivorans]|uniref:glycosyltransferase family 2 protein n=1 Tax=Roseateles chitinivorans TaxID=2917965 RepID=UPI003D669EBD